MIQIPRKKDFKKKVPTQRARVISLSECLNLEDIHCIRVPTLLSGAVREVLTHLL